MDVAVIVGALVVLTFALALGMMWLDSRSEFGPAPVGVASSGAVGVASSGAESAALNARLRAGAAELAAAAAGAKRPYGAREGSVRGAVTLGARRTARLAFAQCDASDSCVGVALADDGRATAVFARSRRAVLRAGPSPGAEMALDRGPYVTYVRKSWPTA